MLKKLRRFAHKTDGSVMIMTALLLVVLVAAGGAAIDLGRQQMVRIKLQQSADAAALAAASLPSYSTDKDRTNTANLYFELNFPDIYLDIPRPMPTITVGGGEISVAADSGGVKTHFMSNLGIGTIPAKGASLVKYVYATQYDVILVMDNSWTMAYDDAGNGLSREVGSNVKTASLSAAQNECQNYFARIQVPAPAGGCASYGTGHRDASGTKPPYGFGLVNDTGTSTRLNGLRYAANFLAKDLLSPPAVGNQVGLVTWNGTVLKSLPLSPDFATVSNEIDQIFAVGVTNSAVGMQEAQKLAANFRPGTVHAVILLTDGQNTINGPMQPNATSKTGGSDNFGCNGFDHCQATDDATLPICDQFKNTGTLVFTFAYGSTVTNPTNIDYPFAQALMKSCASTDANGLSQFYVAPDAAELNKQFNVVLNKLKKIRISQ